jgi:hypothetical protein
VQQLEPEVGGTSGTVQQEIGETSNLNVNDEPETEGMVGSNDLNVVLDDGDIAICLNVLLVVCCIAIYHLFTNLFFILFA